MDFVLNSVEALAEDQPLFDVNALKASASQHTSDAVRRLQVSSSPECRFYLPRIPGLEDVSEGEFRTMAEKMADMDVEGALHGNIMGAKYYREMFVAEIRKTCVAQGNNLLREAFGMTMVDFKRSESYLYDFYVNENTEWKRWAFSKLIDMRWWFNMAARRWFLTAHNQYSLSRLGITGKFVYFDFGKWRLMKLDRFTFQLKDNGSRFCEVWRHANDEAVAFHFEF